MLLRSVRLVLCGLPAIRREPRSPMRLRPGFALEAARAQASRAPGFRFPIKIWLSGLDVRRGLLACLIRRAATFCFSIIMREVVV
jgi:hypothetical protein